MYMYTGINYQQKRCHACNTISACREAAERAGYRKDRNEIQEVKVHSRYIYMCGNLVSISPDSYIYIELQQYKFDDGEGGREGRKEGGREGGREGGKGRERKRERKRKRERE